MVQKVSNVPPIFYQGPPKPRELNVAQLTAKLQIADEETRAGRGPNVEVGVSRVQSFPGEWNALVTYFRIFSLHFFTHIDTNPSH
jgi:hypothetical protein